MQSETPPLTPLQTLLQRSLECSRIIEMIESICLGLIEDDKTINEEITSMKVHKVSKEDI